MTFANKHTVGNECGNNECGNSIMLLIEFTWENE